MMLLGMSAHTMPFHSHMANPHMKEPLNVVQCVHRSCCSLEGHP